VSVAKAPGDGITGAGPAIITTGSGVGDRLTAEKAAPNQAAFLYSCAGADQIRTRDQSSVKNSYVFDWTHQLNQNTQLKLKFLTHWTLRRQMCALYVLEGVRTQP